MSERFWSEYIDKEIVKGAISIVVSNAQVNTPIIVIDHDVDDYRDAEVSLRVPYNEGGAIELLTIFSFRARQLGSCCGGGIISDEKCYIGSLTHDKKIWLGFMRFAEDVTSQFFKRAFLCLTTNGLSKGDKLQIQALKELGWEYIKFYNPNSHNDVRFYHKVVKSKGDVFGEHEPFNKYRFECIE